METAFGWPSHARSRVVITSGCYLDPWVLGLALGRWRLGKGWAWCPVAVLGPERPLAEGWDCGVDRGMTAIGLTCRK